MFRSGYILSGRADLVWFLGLPFFAIAAALATQHWLPAVAAASVGLWITLPHHLATWLRTYGVEDEWRYYKDRLLTGPVVIAGMTMLGLMYAPLTLLLVIALWDHQHSLMQQHGFARIYDFKARAGSPLTPRFDLALNCVLYINLFVTAPYFSTFWIRELYKFHLPISVEAVRVVHTVSWTITGAFLCVYLGHVIWALRQGYSLNPIKYVFLGASFFLWYFVAWQTTSLLIYEVAHKIMHGVQYIVIVLIYLQHKSAREGQRSDLRTRLLHPGNVSAFLVMALVYAVLFQLIARQPLDEFGFGVVNFTGAYDQPIPEFGMQVMTDEAGYHLYAGLIIYSTQLLHYYFDSFIWKVRDKKVQSAL